MEVIFIILGGGVLLGISWLVRKANNNKSRTENQLKELQDSGFKIDYSLIGVTLQLATGSRRQVMDGTGLQVVFDDTERKVAFIFVDGVVSYSYSDIKEWRWDWVDENGAKIKNGISFMLRDKERPLIKMAGLSQNEAELWMAKLDAILND